MNLQKDYYIAKVSRKNKKECFSKTKQLLSKVVKILMRLKIIPNE